MSVRWLLAAALLGLVGLLGRVLWGGGSPATAAAPAPKLAAPPMEPSAPVSAMAAMSGAAAAVSAASEPESAADAQPFVVDLCGIGRMPLRPAAGASEPVALPPHLMALPLAEARQQMLQALAQGNERMRAAAALLAGSQEPSLGALAAGSTDPVVVRWGLSRCRYDDSACRAPLAARLQQLESDNSAAWAESPNASAPLSREQLARMAASARHHLHWGALAALVAAAPPADMAPYLRQALVLEAVGVEAAFALPGFQQLYRICKQPAESGLCRQIADLMVTEVDTLIGYGIGIRLGEVAGWPAGRAAKERAQLRQLTAPSVPDALAKEQQMSCATVERDLAWVQEVGRLGEVGALRQRALAAAPR